MARTGSIAALLAVAVSLLGAGAKLAHALDLNVSTPAIRNLTASLGSRAKTLQPFSLKGAVGETNNGLLELRDLSVLSLPEKAAVSRLVEQENADRQALYAETLRANNLDGRAMPEVQKAFTARWREQSARGSWIQQDDGQWVRK